jgi:hypothetical protein
VVFREEQFVRLEVPCDEFRQSNVAFQVEASNPFDLILKPHCELGIESHILKRRDYFSLTHSSLETRNNTLFAHSINNRPERPEVGWCPGDHSGIAFRNFFEPIVTLFIPMREKTVGGYDFRVGEDFDAAWICYVFDPSQTHSVYEDNIYGVSVGDLWITKKIVSHLSSHTTAVEQNPRDVFVVPIVPDVKIGHEVFLTHQLPQGRVIEGIIPLLEHHSSTADFTRFQ